MTFFISILCVCAVHYLIFCISPSSPLTWCQHFPTHNSPSFFFFSVWDIKRRARTFINLAWGLRVHGCISMWCAPLLCNPQTRSKFVSCVFKFSFTMGMAIWDLAFLHEAYAILTYNISSLHLCCCISPYIFVLYWLCVYILSHGLINSVAARDSDWNVWGCSRRLFISYDVFVCVTACVPYNYILCRIKTLLPPSKYIFCKWSSHYGMHIYMLLLPSNMWLYTPMCI